MDGSKRRKTLDESWDILSTDVEVPRDEQGRPFVPPSIPSPDDAEPVGLSFFRGQWVNSDFSNLMLPRTYFGRSLLERVDFHNSKLSESRMCWNDFISCDFSGADLSGCDMRASYFKGCTFTGSNLRGADLGQARFEDCDFSGAELAGAVIDRPTATACDLHNLLSESQRSGIEWLDDTGPEPPGG